MTSWSPCDSPRPQKARQLPPGPRSKGQSLLSEGAGCQAGPALLLPSADWLRLLAIPSLCGGGDSSQKEFAAA